MIRRMASRISFKVRRLPPDSIDGPVPPGLKRPQAALDDIADEGEIPDCSPSPQPRDFSRIGKSSVSP